MSTVTRPRSEAPPPPAAMSRLLGIETPYGKPVTWAEVAMITDIGTTHAWNDDRCLVVTFKDLGETTSSPWREFMLCLVADGATSSSFGPHVDIVETSSGGRHAGWRASQVAQGAFVVGFMNSQQPDPLDKLRDGLRAADRTIQDANEGSLQTTLTALFLSADGTARAASIGDSVLAVLSPEHASKGSKKPKKLGYEDSTAVGSGQTRSTNINQDQLIETWWPNKEGGSAESRIQRGTYLVLMSDGISDNMKIPAIEQLLRRHPLDRVTVGLPKRTRENREQDQKKSGASTRQNELGLDNMSAIVVRFDGARGASRPATVPRLEDASLVCAMGTYGGPEADSGGQFGLVCLAGQENGATAAPEFLRQFLESEHRLDVRARIEQAWRGARPSRNQARFSALYADDHGLSFTFANDPARGAR